MGAVAREMAELGAAPCHGVIVVMVVFKERVRVSSLQVEVRFV